MPACFKFLQNWKKNYKKFQVWYTCNNPIKSPDITYNFSSSFQPNFRTLAATMTPKSTLATPRLYIILNAKGERQTKFTTSWISGYLFYTRQLPNSLVRIFLQLMILHVNIGHSWYAIHLSSYGPKNGAETRKFKHIGPKVLALGALALIYGRGRVGTAGKLLPKPMCVYIRRGPYMLEHTVLNNWLLATSSKNLPGRWSFWWVDHILNTKYINQFCINTK